jgi:hypothetical protein
MLVVVDRLNRAPRGGQHDARAIRKGLEPVGGATTGRASHPRAARRGGAGDSTRRERPSEDDQCFGRSALRTHIRPITKRSPILLCWRDLLRHPTVGHLGGLSYVGGLHRLGGLRRLGLPCPNQLGVSNLHATVCARGVQDMEDRVLGSTCSFREPAEIPGRHRSVRIVIVE